jgi:L-fucose mutarotase/ribose pyranase (RbsD/FucU family)
MSQFPRSLYEPGHGDRAMLCKAHTPTTSSAVPLLADARKPARSTIAHVVPADMSSGDPLRNGEEKRDRGYGPHPPAA